MSTIRRRNFIYSIYIKLSRSFKKNYSLINDYKWFIYFGQNNEKDYLVIGSSPDEFICPDTGKKIYQNIDMDKEILFSGNFFGGRRGQETMLRKQRKQGRVFLARKRVHRVDKRPCLRRFKNGLAWHVM